MYRYRKKGGEKLVVRIGANVLAISAILVVVVGVSVLTHGALAGLGGRMDALEGEVENILPIGTPDIAAGAVTTPKLAANAVTSAQIAPGAVTSPDIATGAVTTAHIATDAVTTDKIATGAVTTDKIATGAVTTAHIATGAVTTDDIATGAVTTLRIADNAVTTPKIADNAVTMAKMVIKWGSVMINPPSIPAGVSTNVDVTVIGLVVADNIIAMCQGALENGLVPQAAWVHATNTLRVRLFNSTAVAIDGAPLPWVWMRLP
jgi:hypothetical protein